MGTSLTPPSAATIRILIADDHALFREALRKLLENERDLRVAGDAVDGREAIRLALELRPDVLLLDVRMPGTSVADVLRAVARIAPPVRTLLLTADLGDADLVEALSLGARGIVMKQAAPELLFRSIRAVVAGEYWLGRDCVAGLIDKVRSQQAPSPPEARGRTLGLTSRELQMVSAVVAGASNRDIAAQCAISPKTVKHHLTSIFGKLGVGNRLELALFAMQRRFDAERFFD